MDDGRVNLHPPTNGYNGTVLEQPVNVAVNGEETLSGSVTVEIVSAADASPIINLVVTAITDAGEQDQIVLLAISTDNFTAGAQETVAFGPVSLPANIRQVVSVDFEKIGFGEVTLAAVDVAISSGTVGPVPEITGLSSNHGVYGSLLTIFGTGFGTEWTQGSVEIGEDSAGVQVVSWSDTEVQVRVNEPTNSGYISLFRNYVDNLGVFAYQIDTPYFHLEGDSEAEQWLGEEVVLPFVLMFENGYEPPEGGIQFSCVDGDGAPVAGATFSRSIAHYSGGYVLRLPTDSMSAGTNEVFIEASEVTLTAAALLPRQFPVRAMLYTVDRCDLALSWWDESSVYHNEAVTGDSFTWTKQSAIPLTFSYVGAPNDWAPMMPVGTVTSGNPAVVSAIRLGSMWDYYRFYALSNGTSVLTFNGPNGFTRTVTVTVAIPEGEALFSAPSLAPSEVSNSGTGIINYDVQSTHSISSIGGTPGWPWDDDDPDNYAVWSDSNRHVSRTATVWSPAELGVYCLTASSSNGVVDVSVGVPLEVTNASTFAGARIQALSLFGMGEGQLNLYTPEQSPSDPPAYELWSGYHGEPVWRGAIAPGNYKVKVADWSGEGVWLDNAPDWDSTGVLNFPADTYTPLDVVTLNRIIWLDQWAVTTHNTDHTLSILAHRTPPYTDAETVYAQVVAYNAVAGTDFEAPLTVSTTHDAQFVFAAGQSTATLDLSILTNNEATGNRYLMVSLLSTEGGSNLVEPRTTGVSITTGDGTTGNLTVVIDPPEAAAAGAQWRMDGGSWQDSGATLTGLTPGEVTVEYGALAGWLTPASRTALIVIDATTAITGSYTPDPGGIIGFEQPFYPQGALPEPWTTYEPSANTVQVVAGGQAAGSQSLQMTAYNAYATYPLSITSSEGAIELSVMVNPSLYNPGSYDAGYQSFGGMGIMDGRGDVWAGGVYFRMQKPYGETMLPGYRTICLYSPNPSTWGGYGLTIGTWEATGYHTIVQRWDWVNDIYTVKVYLPSGGVVTYTDTTQGTTSLTYARLYGSDFTINYDQFNPGSAPLAQVATPTFDPAPGTYGDDLQVTIACATEGATIRYTTDGSDVEDESPIYAAPIALTASATIKAQAFKSGMEASNVASATYTVKPSLSIAGAELAEGDAGTTAMKLTVTLSSASASTITVVYATSSGTATTNTDFEPTAGTLTFSPGITSQDVVVQIKGDMIDEPDETFTVTLSTPVNATIATDKATGTILDDDTPSVSIADASVTEGDTGTVSLDFAVTLSLPSTYTITVNWATADGTATAGDDYAAASGTVSFSPGDTSKTVSVTVNGDELVEPNETLTVSLSSLSRGVVGRGAATGTIVNDDSAMLSIGDATVGEAEASVDVAVTLSRASSTEVTCLVSENGGSATKGVDYAFTATVVTFAPGETSKTVTVSVIDDGLVEGDENVILVITDETGAGVADGSGSVLILDNDLPKISIADNSRTEGDAGSADLVFTVTLDVPCLAPVTVDYATSNGSATAGADYTAVSGTLTFGVGEDTKTINVPILGDTIDEPDETFTVTLSDPAGATLLDATATGTINDDDLPQLTLTVSPGAMSENGGSATGTVSRATGLAAPLDVTLSSSDTSEATVPAMVTIAAGLSTATFTVQAVDDALTDGTQTVTLTAEATDYRDGTTTIEVLDDDQTHLVVYSLRSSQALIDGPAVRTNLTGYLLIDLDTHQAAAVYEDGTTERWSDDDAWVMGSAEDLGLFPRYLIVSQQLPLIGGDSFALTSLNGRVYGALTIGDGLTATLPTLLSGYRYAGDPTAANLLVGRFHGRFDATVTIGLNDAKRAFEDALDDLLGMIARPVSAVEAPDVAITALPAYPLVYRTRASLRTTGDGSVTATTRSGYLVAVSSQLAHITYWVDREGRHYSLDDWGFDSSVTAYVADGGTSQIQVYAIQPPGLIAAGGDASRLQLLAGTQVANTPIGAVLRASVAPRLSGRWHAIDWAAESGDYVFTDGPWMASLDNTWTRTANDDDLSIEEIVAGIVEVLEARGYEAAP